jgi:hypothetical protein
LATQKSGGPALSSPSYLRFQPEVALKLPLVDIF